MHDIHYAITPADPAAHLFRVRCVIRKPDPEGQILSLPAWIPGSYLIRDFAKNIVSISARDAGDNTLTLHRLDKHSWQAPPARGELRLDYEVYAWDPSVRAACLDTEMGFFNGTSVFLRVHGREQVPCSVAIEPPAAPWGPNWRVATAMPRLDAKPHAFGTYQAADYDALIDHPVGLGSFTLGRFEAAGAAHEVALFGRHHADMDRLCRDLKPLCEQHIHMFDDKPPVDYYLFLVRVVGEGYGGIEHRASSALVCARDGLPQSCTPQDAVDERYRELLGLFSHEYFHTWNIKRIKPAAFTPYDLQRENYTELLWAFEGITSYYDDLGVLRSGLITPESYLEMLGRLVTRVLRGKGRLRQTVAESSFYAWTKFYQQDENAPNAIVSYYAKGALIALCLDLLIRQTTAGERSLDDVMRVLWERYGKTGTGVPEDGVETAAREIGGDELKTFFDKALRSTDELPLQELLHQAGVTMYLRAAEHPQDKGGKRRADGAPAVGVDSGLRFKADGNSLIVIAVDAGGAAQRAGVSPGDKIIACNGLQASNDRLVWELAAAAPGDELRLHAFRRDELMEFQLELQAPEADTCYLEVDSGADGERLQIRRGWLGR